MDEEMYEQGTKQTFLLGLGLCLSILPISVFLTGDCWMFFSYCLFMLCQLFTTVFAFKDEEAYYVQKDKEALVVDSIIVSLTTLVSLYPFYFMLIGKYEGGVIVALLCLLTTGLVGFIAWQNIDHVINRTDYQEKYEEEQNRKKNYEQKRKNQKENQRLAEAQKYKDAEQKYGKITSSLCCISPEDSFDDKIIVYSDTKTIILQGRVFTFKDILGCTYNDEQSIHKGVSTAVTTTDTGNMIGRAAVGGLLLGSAGAIIGGSTAKNNTKIMQTDDIVTHNYTISISVNDLANPNISISTPYLSVANKLVALINAVMANK